MKGGPPWAIAWGESTASVINISGAQNRSTANSPARAKGWAAIQPCLPSKRGNAVRTNPHLQRSLDLDIFAGSGSPPPDLARNSPLARHRLPDDRLKASTSSWVGYRDAHSPAQPCR